MTSFENRTHILHICLIVEFERLRKATNSSRLQSVEVKELSEIKTNIFKGKFD